MNSEDKKFQEEIRKILKEADENISVPESLDSKNLLPLISGITPDMEQVKKTKIISFSKKLALPVAAVLVIAVSVPLLKNGNIGFLMADEKSADMMRNTATNNNFDCAAPESCEETAQSSSEACYAEGNTSSQSEQTMLKSAGIPNNSDSSFIKVNSIDDIKNAVSKYRVSMSDRALPNNMEDACDKSIYTESDSVMKNSTKEKAYFLNLDIPEENSSFSAFVNEDGSYSIDLLKNKEVENTLSIKEAKTNLFMEYGENTLYIAYDKINNPSENSIVSCFNAYEFTEDVVNLKYSFSQDGRLMDLIKKSQSEITLCSEMSIADTDITLIPDEKLVPNLYDKDENEKNIVFENIKIAKEMLNSNYTVTTDIELKDGEYVLKPEAILGK